MDWFLSLVFMSECINAWSKHLSIGIVLDGPVNVYKYSQVFFSEGGGGLIWIIHIFIHLYTKFIPLFTMKNYYERRENWANIK